MRKSVIKESQAEVVDALCSYIEQIAKESIEQRGVFTVGVSGGSLATFLANGLPSISTDWSKWRVFFCDERHVPFDNGNSTYKIYKEGLMSRVPLPDEHVVKINPELTVEKAAVDYTEKMKKVFPGCEWPVFDLLLLGMGPDGHTCSLFPGHPLLDEDSVWVSSISDSPKPPPQRITMTFPVINKARNAAFAACGAGKAEMVQRVLQGGDNPPLPASRISSQSVTWFLDSSAAGLISKV